MTLLAAFNNLDTFAWVGTFSAGLPPMPGVAVPIDPPANAANLRGPDITNTIDKAKLAALLPQLNADANARLRLFYVGIGAAGRPDHRAQRVQGTAEGEGREGHDRRDGPATATSGPSGASPSRTWRRGCSSRPRSEAAVGGPAPALATPANRGGPHYRGPSDRLTMRGPSARPQRLDRPPHFVWRFFIVMPIPTLCWPRKIQSEVRSVVTAAK